MIKCTDCLRCGSKNIDKIMVNTRISLNYPEEKDYYSGIASQRVITPTNAIVCKDCGHIEFYINWTK